MEASNNDAQKVILASPPDTFFLSNAVKNCKTLYLSISPNKAAFRKEHYFFIA